MGTWEVLDHTADLAIEAHGADAKEALDAFCVGLLTQVTDPNAAEPREAVDIRAEGWDAPETLVTALGEVLYWLNVRGWAFRRIETVEVLPTRITLRAWGEPRNSKRHPLHAEIKAATYHELFFGPDPDDPESEGWLVRVVLDV